MKYSSQNNPRPISRRGDSRIALTANPTVIPAEAGIQSSDPIRRPPPFSFQVVSVARLMKYSSENNPRPISRRGDSRESPLLLCCPERQCRGCVLANVNPLSRSRESALSPPPPGADRGRQNGPVTMIRPHFSVIPSTARNLKSITEDRTAGGPLLSWPRTKTA